MQTAGSSKICQYHAVIRFSAIELTLNFRSTKDCFTVSRLDPMHATWLADL